MSQANVEIAERAIEAFNTRDRDVYDQLFTPDFEMLPALATSVESGAVPGTRRLESVSDGARRHLGGDADNR
jgi:hypothetical protein